MNLDYNIIFWVIFDLGRFIFYPSLGIQIDPKMYCKKSRAQSYKVYEAHSILILICNRYAATTTGQSESTVEAMLIWDDDKEFMAPWGSASYANAYFEATGMYHNPQQGAAVGMPTPPGRELKFRDDKDIKGDLVIDHHKQVEVRTLKVGQTVPNLVPSGYNQASLSCIESEPKLRELPPLGGDDLTSGLSSLDAGFDGESLARMVHGPAVDLSRNSVMESPTASPMANTLGSQRDPRKSHISNNGKPSTPGQLPFQQQRKRADNRAPNNRRTVLERRPQLVYTYWPVLNF